MRRRTEGFALLAVLALLAVVGLYTAATLQDALFGTVLAHTRVAQQRAFLLADLGIQSALEEIGSASPPGDYTRELRPLPGAQNAVTVVLRSSDDALPAGYSAAHFIMRRFEIESTGRSSRGARAVQVQGVLRVLPAAAPTEEP
jgi:hypothetical protein